jgi:hypothetical protein
VVALRRAFDAAFVAKLATGHVLGGGATRRVEGGIAGEGWGVQGTVRRSDLQSTASSSGAA